MTEHESRIPDPLLNVRGVASYLGRGVSTVWKDVREGRLPKPVYLSPRAPRWRLSALDAAISAK